MTAITPGAILEWRPPNGIGPLHRWRVLGVYLGTAAQENLIEIKPISHKPGQFTVGAAGHGIHVIEAETMLVPECLLRAPAVTVVGA